jgi:hypothetical protein
MHCGFGRKIKAPTKCLKSCVDVNPKEYDCFLSYRVATNQALVERLYWCLRSEGLNPFFDKECLVLGEGWKEQFLRGLRSSRYFVACTSADGLTSARDRTRDHSEDNVLLEYQMALEINEKRNLAKKPEFIVPILIAKADGNALVKFRDFSESFYSDSVAPIESPAQESSHSVPGEYVC